MPLLTDDKKYNGSGKLITTSLFEELTNRPEFVCLSLSRKEKKYPSFPQLYLKYCKDDPTEYTFAMEVFGDWHWWDMIRRDRRISGLVEELKTEIEVYLRAKGFKTVLQEAKSGGRSSFTAAKFLVDKGWEPVSKRSKKEKDREEEVLDKVSQEIAEDAERLGFLKVVK
jgi:hypothetical protein